MGILQRFSLMFLGNGIALYLVNAYLSDVSISLVLENFIIVVSVLSLINLFIRPLVRLALGPILLLTLGLGGILVNMATLFILDILLVSVAFTTIYALIITSIVVSMVNLVISFSAKFI